VEAAFLITGNLDHGRLGAALCWLSNYAWAAVKPHLPKNEVEAKLARCLRRCSTSVPLCMP
ncbi:hypothetical protein, partial [Klebsiella pneumoniae]|uniref:hypothetical protein n=1 Tax=Klebsiella pneumoniae TaxID=573 RepID=UPI003AF8BA3A